MTKIYLMEEMALLDKKKIPFHVAIIMDGNRRWEKKQGLPLLSGHNYGADNLNRIVRAACELGIKVVTVYAFSTENRSRSKLEVSFLSSLFEKYMVEQRELLRKEGVRLDCIGAWKKMSPNIQKVVEETKEFTKNGKNIDLVIAVNYGGRDEIRRASIRMVEDVEKKILTKEQITEDLFSQYLDTSKWPDPDLLIRTGGEKRLSNFLLWQASYAEMILIDTLWPDFSEKHLFDAVLEFQKRNRRKGG
ncbi:MAG: polyprenyl diphosphate synthase [Chlamydiota bacterium]